MAGRHEAVAQVLLEHSYDHDHRECMCGHRPWLHADITDHVAAEILAALDKVPGEALPT